MIDLSHRHDIPEAMDDPDFPDAEYQRCLSDLAALNRLTLTHRPTLRWLARATRDWPRGAPVSVLDVACGHGDLLRAIHRWATRAGLRPVLSGVDLNPRSASVAAAATPAGMDIAWHHADVFDYAPEPRPDFIVSSQFAHHLSDAQVVALLGWMDRYAGRGWFLVDLHRHVLPYYGFRLLCWAMGWHRVVRLDGTISIARAFSRAEWAALLRRAGIVAAHTRWHLPFRLSACRLR
jgi:SAM-dependent methyltransferase